MNDLSGLRWLARDVLPDAAELLESVPAPLLKRLDSAQQLVSQAAGTAGGKKAKRLMRKGIKALKQATGLAAKAAKKGTISTTCAASVATEFSNAKTAADSWLRTR